MLGLGLGRLSGGGRGNGFNLASRRVIGVGDSRIAQETTRTFFDQSGTNVSYENVGPINWSRLISRQKFDFFDVRDNFGVGGENSTQSLGRLQTALSQGLDFGACIWLSSTNDRSQGFTADQTKANLDAAVALVRSVHRPFLIRDEYPRGDSTFTALRLTQPQLGYHYEVSRYIRQVLHDPAHDVFAVESFKDLEDRSQLTGDILSGKTQDGLHLNTAGCILMYPSLGDVLEMLWPPRDLLADYQTNNVLTNPDLTGSGGVSGSLWAGVIPTGYTGSGGSGAVGCTATMSTVIDPLGNTWGKVVLSGTPVGDAAEISLRQDISAGFVAGQIVDLGADIIIQNPTNLAGVGLRCIQQATVGGTTVFDGRDMDRRDINSQIPDGTRAIGQLRLPNYVIQPGVLNLRTNVVSIFTGTNGVAVGGTIYFRRPKLTIT